jgi:hypothetical protein
VTCSSDELAAIDQLAAEILNTCDLGAGLAGCRHRDCEATLLAFDRLVGGRGTTQISEYAGGGIPISDACNTCVKDIPTTLCIVHVP